MLGFLFRFFKRANHKYFSKDKFFVERLRTVLGFTPSNIYLFKLAFYHKSTLNNQNNEKLELYQSNERLEFLGDALLSFVVGEYLFNKYPSANEGFLTKMRSKIVKRKTLNDLAEQMGLDRLMMEFNQTAISQSMLGNALEALIGAIYLERGFDFTKKYILKKILRKYINISQLETYDDNFKSQLLEWCQKNTKEIDFRVISKYKTDKRDRFKVGVFVDGVEIASAEDYNKKSAEQIASEIALSQLNI
ncbi:MAG: ribonuclease III [Saprospiraceae bacterium]|nr:ribonuclease III [Candidatus Vicinibacter affinis]HQX43251.1 ribonuclease III [Saprospiraceae bacterium]MBK7303653.1 ribonuclease III [Candidatus Vicinibacter affinis]MBK7800744.1 ribonuclease III [Candidatus Vicinibacter affinis]MBK8405585.1 ribonuclease III [Candidatus Vicinibacter affinis]